MAERRPYMGSHASLSQMGGVQRKATNRDRASGPRPVWIDQFQPTKNHLRPDIIRILDASYPTEIPDEAGENLVKVSFPWWSWTEHRDNYHEKSCVCSAGPWAGNKKKAAACRGCELFFGLMKRDPVSGRMKLGPMSKRDMFSFSVIHYHPYHRVEQLDEDGVVKKNNQGEPFWRWVRCEIDGCPHCAAGKLTIPARKLHWDMGTSHRATLFEKDEMLRRCCKSCRTRNSLTWEAFVCANEECEHPFFRHGETKIKEEDVFKAVKDRMLCPVCGAFDVPRQYNKCLKCGDNPEPSTIFDVILHVHRKATDGTNGTELKIDDWEEAYDGVYVPPEIAAFDEEMAKNFHVPLDLPKLIKPTDIPTQNRLFGAGGPSSPDWQAAGGPAGEEGQSARQPVASEYGKGGNQ